MVKRIAAVAILLILLGIGTAFLVWTLRPYPQILATSGSSQREPVASVPAPIERKGDEKIRIGSLEEEEKEEDKRGVVLDPAQEGDSWRTGDSGSGDQEVTDDEQETLDEELLAKEYYGPYTMYKQWKIHIGKSQDEFVKRFMEARFEWLAEAYGKEVVEVERSGLEIIFDAELRDTWNMLMAYVDAYGAMGHETKKSEGKRLYMETDESVMRVLDEMMTLFHRIHSRMKRMVLDQIADPSERRKLGDKIESFPLHLNVYFRAMATDVLPGK